MTTSHALAVALAGLGAVLFGLAAARQHRAVREQGAAPQPGNRRPSGPTLDLRDLARLVRQPSWLVGAGQAVVAGGAHITALGLAPLTLVQPVGVIAVPVTVVATALTARRRPTGSALAGAALSVAGIAVLTVLLLSPPAEEMLLPRWPVVALVVAVALAVAALAALTPRKASLLRCLALATGAALLFGLNSILLRTVGHLIGTHVVAAQIPVLAAAALGLVVALPAGLWAMQTAYLAGSAQVVLCCLTLVDPLVAVLGGHLLLHDGVAVRGDGWVAVAGCAVLAAVGVVLLSRDGSAETGPGAGAPPSAPAPALPDH